MTTVTGDIAVMLSVLGLRKGDARILDALVLLGPDMETTELDCGDVLTREVSGWSVDQTLGAYEWIWADEGLRTPIAATDYVPVAAEANGNLTLAHRRTGQVVWFAPDHFASGVTVLPGCPEYSLYTFDGAPDLASWIETGAVQWAQ
ncbi:hypothetical protein [Promicromonospora sp. NPDC023987]|uniref:hypothetical protein n=1 Tax=Promicromonospora sp. NPDC023987 TaxID=3155360 RepID=UPI0033CF62FF